MILEFKLPLVMPQMSEAVIECLYPAPGSVLKSGEKLLDLSVDLSNNFAQDCPPISFFRIVIREAAVLREFRVVPGATIKLGEVIALFSTTADEPLDQPIMRGLRTATAGIIHHGGMWTGNAA